MTEPELQKTAEELLDKAEKVDYDIRLPETEFDVMRAVWEKNTPVNTGYLMDRLGTVRGWRVPTLISFLRRLEERGFLASVKKGRERLYFPLAEQEKYLQAATKRFVAKYHGGSLGGVMASLYPDRRVPEKDIDTLLEWLSRGE